VPNTTEKLQELIDGSDICEMLGAYFRGLDSPQPWPGPGRICGGCTLGSERSAVARWPSRDQVFMNAWPTQLVVLIRQRERTTASHHFMAPPSIVGRWRHSDDRDVRSRPLAKATATDGGVITVRALRYMDKLRRTEQGWKIVDRLHVADMAMSVPALFATTFGERRGAT